MRRTRLHPFLTHSFLELFPSCTFQHEVDRRDQLRARCVGVKQRLSTSIRRSTPHRFGFLQRTAERRIFDHFEGYFALFPGQCGAHAQIMSHVPAEPKDQFRTQKRTSVLSLVGGAFVPRHSARPNETGAYCDRILSGRGGAAPFVVFKRCVFLRFEICVIGESGPTEHFPFF